MRAITTRDYPVIQGTVLFIAALYVLVNLLVDLTYVEQGVKAGVPKGAEWYAAFGIVSSIVWIYLEVLRLLAQGKSNREIADELVITELTVRTHVSHILAKLSLGNRTQAALYALRVGLVTLEEIGRAES